MHAVAVCEVAIIANISAPAAPSRDRRRDQGRDHKMYFGILGITVIDLTFNAVLEALERYFTRWKAPA